MDEASGLPLALIFEEILDQDKKPDETKDTKDTNQEQPPKDPT